MAHDARHKRANTGNILTRLKRKRHTEVFAYVEPPRDRAGAAMLAVEGVNRVGECEKY